MNEKVKLAIFLMLAAIVSNIGVGYMFPEYITDRCLRIPLPADGRFESYAHVFTYTEAVVVWDTPSLYNEIIGRLWHFDFSYQQYPLSPDQAAKLSFKSIEGEAVIDAVEFVPGMYYVNSGGGYVEQRIRQCFLPVIHTFIMTTTRG